jgi:hypothetical protein
LLAFGDAIAPSTWFGLAILVTGSAVIQVGRLL